MKYSIIIPVHNGEKYIEKCIESVLKQKYNNYEIIIINDNSNDNTTNIIKKYNIKVYNVNYNNIGKSRNYGVLKAKGDYIIFIDADDYIDDNLLETIEKYTYPYDIIRFQPLLIKNNHILYKNKFTFNKNRIYKNGIKALEDWSRKELRYGVFWIYCIKRDLIKKIYHLKYYEDTLTIPLILKKSNKIICIKYYGYYHNINNMSLSSKINDKMKLKYFKYTCKILLQEFKDNEIVHNYYLHHLQRKISETN